ncbi:MAG: hypothetical protein ACK41W_12305 [Cyanobacteriota bacterium]|jgi:hypothetical protein
MVADPRRHRFRVGLSFPGALREGLVKHVAEFLKVYIGNNDDQFGIEQVLYDHYHIDEFAVLRLRDDLQLLYRNECNLIVVFLCREYAESDWCGLEWEQIKQLAETQRKSIYLLWHGERDEAILAKLGLSWKVDGFWDITKVEPLAVARGILRRLEQLDSDAQGSIANQIPPAICYAKPLPPKSPCFLAVIFLPSKIAEKTFSILAYLSDDYGSSYGLIDLSGCNDRFRLSKARKDWQALAQAIVNMQNQYTKAGVRMQAELFLPIELLANLGALDLLNVQCQLDEDKFVKCGFAACCPVIIRPLDRYYRRSLYEKVGHLKNKFDALSTGNGKWIYGKDATKGDAIISLRESPQHVAVQLIENFPSRSDDVMEWLASLIASMMPLAVWWAGKDYKKIPLKKRQSHLGSYTSPCGTRHLLNVGNEGRACLNMSDLDHLPILRKYCAHHRAARSLVLFIDNPGRMPDIPIRDPNVLSCVRKPSRRPSL